MVSCARAPVIPANADSQNVKEASSAATTSFFAVFAFSIPLIVGFSPLALAQNMKLASAMCANSAPIDRTSGVGLKAYMSSGTCSAALRMLPFTRSNVLLTLATVGSAA